MSNMNENNNSEINNIHWYPGHMTKAKRMMQENIKLIDIVIELLDARIPMSSKNPDIDELAKNKFRLVLLNKADLADPSVTAEWENYYKEKGFFVLCLDSRKNTGMKLITDKVKEVCRAKIERDKQRGIIGSPIRAMVAGIPNVGKSTFINSYSKKAVAKVGNKPGVTRGKQWIRIDKNVELLDTPGILWPKFEDKETGLRLSYIGSINDDILAKSEIALLLIGYLKNNYCNTLADRYNINIDKENFEILSDIAIIRKCLKKGNEPDLDKAANLLLEDFRSGKLGRISLERPQ